MAKRRKKASRKSVRKAKRKTVRKTARKARKTRRKPRKAKQRLGRKARRTGRRPIAFKRIKKAAPKPAPFSVFIEDTFGKGIAEMLPGTHGPGDDRNS